MTMEIALPAFFPDEGDAHFQEHAPAARFYTVVNNKAEVFMCSVLLFEGAFNPISIFV